MTNEGYIKDYRKKLSWEWFSDPFTAHFFEYCCLKAQYEDTTYRTIPITRGSFTASLNTMSVETGLSVQSIRTAIKHLTLTNDIVCQATNEFTLITVCKYNDYQADTNTANKQANTPANTQINTPANTLSKNIRREEEDNIPPYNPPTAEKPKRTSRQFVRPSLEEVTDYCQERGNNIDPQHFLNYYDACGWTVGKNKPMKDWKAAIRNWESMRKQQSTPTPANNPAGILLGPGEFIRQDGSRTYGTGIVTVPQSAPPRPNERCTWSSQYNNWIM